MHLTLLTNTHSHKCPIVQVNNGSGKSAAQEEVEFVCHSMFEHVAWGWEVNNGKNATTTP